MDKLVVKYTMDTLIAKGFEAITVKSTTVDPNDWYFTKQEDGMFWPCEKREKFIIVDTTKQIDAKKLMCEFSFSSEAGPGKICFYHTKTEIPANYSVHDYVMEHGHELVEVWNPDKNCTEFSTLLKLFKDSVSGLRNYRHGKIKSTTGEGGFVYYADYDKARASQWLPNEKLMREWANKNGIVLLDVEWETVGV